MIKDSAMEDNHGVAFEMNKVTFKEKLLGSHPKEKSLVMADEISDDEEEIIGGEDESDCPTIHVSKSEKARLRSPWKQTIIVKVLGKRIGYYYLEKRLRAIWRPKAAMDVVAIENDFFLVKFTQYEDYAFALYEGPWMIADHYLTVRKWCPNFDPETATTNSILAWIHFPCLPIEYYDEEFLMRVGSHVGKPIKIDANTSDASCGKFARICVELDLQKPLCPSFG